MNSSQNDLKLLQDMQEGRESALRDLFNKYAEKLFAVSFAILKDTGWSEDTVQEVFVKLWENSRKISIKESIWPYLYVLTKHQSFKKLRDIKPFTPEFESLWLNISHLTDCSYEQLILKETQEKIKTIVEMMPERQRQIFHLSREQGMTHQEIAEHLGISQNTVKNHMVQAIGKLRKVLSKAKYFNFLFL